MGAGLRAYLSRGYYLRIEKRIDVRAIVACWAFNAVVAFLVFVAAWLMTSNPFATVLYTLSAWACTLVLSVVYWLYWIQRRLGKPGIRMLASSLIIFMLAAGLLVLWQTILLLTRVAQL